MNFISTHFLLCFLLLQMNQGIEDVHLLTFGQPRIGNAAFASCFYKYIPNTFRIVHNRDIVPHLPPYYSFYWKSYHHYPREVLTTENQIHFLFIFIIFETVDWLWQIYCTQCILHALDLSDECTLKVLLLIICLGMAPWWQWTDLWWFWRRSIV